jgi:hypothetical protein
MVADSEVLKRERDGDECDGEGGRVGEASPEERGDERGRRWPAVARELFEHGASDPGVELRAELRRGARLDEQGAARAEPGDGAAAAFARGDVRRDLLLPPAFEIARRVERQEPGGPPAAYLPHRAAPPLLSSLSQ